MAYSRTDLQNQRYADDRDLIETNLSDIESELGGVDTLEGRQRVAYLSDSGTQTLTGSATKVDVSGGTLTQTESDGTPSPTGSSTTRARATRTRCATPGARPRPLTFG